MQRWSLTESMKIIEGVWRTRARKRKMRHPSSSSLSAAHLLSSKHKYHLQKHRLPITSKSSLKTLAANSAGHIKLIGWWTNSKMLQQGNFNSCPFNPFLLSRDISHRLSVCHFRNFLRLGSFRQLLLPVWSWVRTSPKKLRPSNPHEPIWFHIIT